MRIWDPATGEQRAALEGHQEWVDAVCAVTVDGEHLLASGGNDRTVRIWDPVTGACVIILPTYHAALAVTQIAESVAIGLDAGILVIKPSLIS